jgi:serine protease Do
MTRLFTAVAATVTLLGVFALMFLLAPAVKGQTAKPRPYFELKSQILGSSGIGVSVRDVDEADLKREKLPALGGAVVEDVQTDSPAAKAGMKAGDVIVSFDGEKVRSARHLSRLIEETPAGRDVETTVIRAGEKVAMKMAPVSTDVFSRLEPLMKRRLELAAPETFRFSAKPDPGSGFYRSFIDRRFGWNGVTVQDLSGQLGEYFGTREGVLVTAVEDGSAAKTLGLKAGDVITKIGDYTVRSTADWWRRMSAASGEVAVTIVRDRKEMTLKGKIE